MSKLMGWKVQEGMYGILDRYFVKKDKRTSSGYSISGINQEYNDWKPSKNIVQDLRVAEKIFCKYTIAKSICKASEEV